jgi:alpha-amylase
MLFFAIQINISAMAKFILFVSLFTVSIFFTRCRPEIKTEKKPDAVTTSFEKPLAPEWHKNAVIYEVNLRHFTPEGTFNAFKGQIPRLKELGVDILWFMPIHPVSRKNSKGTLGSPYAVADYLNVSPNYGTLDDFKSLVRDIHAAGLHCIIDWVPNHTGWDNPWITQHPDWYTHDDKGNIVDPINPKTGKSWGWTDVADLNFDNPEMRLGMIDAMKFWVKDIGIDGFRVDVAHGIPVDFWAQCSDSLYRVKPLFMLAEAEVPAIVNNGAFVMDYAWEMHHLFNEIAETQGANRDKTAKLVQGNLVTDAKNAQKVNKNALDIDRELAKTDSLYDKGYKMQFTSNHDENSWSGTEFQRLGEGHKAFQVLAATFDGMPLIYTGMESAMNKRLEFFEKDLVPWGDYPYAAFYKTLFDLKHRNKALWNGEYGGKLVKILTGKDTAVYAFYREKDGDKVVAVINLSAAAQDITLRGNGYAGSLINVFNGEKTELKEGMALKLKPWEYWVWSSN